MDPNSTYYLEIRLFGNKKKARKDFRCFRFDMTIDSDVTNYKDLVENIVNKYPPGYLEVAHVQYYNHDIKAFFEVLSDQDLLCMFEKNSKSKVVDMFISYCDPSEPFEPIKEYDDVQNQAANNGDQDKDLDKDRYLSNPLPQNEHVGVDEEVMYLGKEPIEAANMTLWQSIFLTWIMIKKTLLWKLAPHILIWLSLRFALSQHAIKHQYEFNTEKSTPQRFRAYCSKWKDDKCTWRIHASSTDDFCTVVVIF
jgi:hypothetical protein